MRSATDPFQRITKEFPDIIETACWSGFGQGWYTIVRDLCLTIKALNETKYHDTPSKIKIEQIKEKFGLLRIYLNKNDDDELKRIISKAIEATSITCESCGKMGKIREDGWIRVRCDSCEEWESKR